MNRWAAKLHATCLTRDVFHRDFTKAWFHLRGLVVLLAMVVPPVHVYHELLFVWEVDTSEKEKDEGA